MATVPPAPLKLVKMELESMQFKENLSQMKKLGGGAIANADREGRDKN